MTVSGLSSATLQSLMSQLNSGSTSGSSNSATSLLNELGKTAQSSASSTANSAQSDPAYVLSASQQQNQSQLLSYSNMGALINKTEGSLTSLINQSSQGVAVDGLGRPLTNAVSVDVNSLASAQTLTSGSFPADDTGVLGTGTLNVTVGSGTAVPITITDGSLNGVAKAINDASAGIAASVKQNSDGSYSLQIVGSNTGAENTFSLSGISDLTYNPTTDSGTLSATAKAADASYTVNGVGSTSPSNENVQVAPGVVTSFTQTGPQSVASPVGQSNATQTAQSLVSDFNSLVSADPTASSSSSSNSTSITKMLDQIAGQSFSVDGTSKSLADYGITVGSNGSLSVDQSTLTSAYSADPAGFNSVISQAAKAINDTLSSNNGVATQIQSSMSNLVTQMVHMPSLAEILAGNSSGASGSSSTSSASQLLAGMSA